MSIKVVVNLSCWQGYSLGASHYNVKITRGNWEDAQREVYRHKFDTYEQAKAYINGILAEHFPPDTHEYVSSGETELQFVYDRIGD